jgi:hypothetical protein
MGVLGLFQQGWARSSCQQINLPDAAWVFGAVDQNRGYERAERFQVSSMVTSFMLRGLQQQYVAGSWGPCDDERATIVWRVYADEAGRPGTLLHEETRTLALRPLSVDYGGGTILQELFLPVDPALRLQSGWFSVQGVGSGGCLLLWGSSSEGDGVSALNRGVGWELAAYDLNLCVDWYELPAPDLNIGLVGDLVRLSWKPVPGATSYQIWRAVEEQAFVPVGMPQSTTSWVDGESATRLVSRYRITALQP